MTTPTWAGPVSLRVIEPGDERLIAAMSDEVSIRSLHLRFFAGMPSIPAGAVRQLADVDHEQIEAVLALVDGAAVGWAQWVRDPRTGVPEIAVLVSDAWQGRGVGSRLFAKLAELAAQRGIPYLSAWVLPQNEAAKRTLAGVWPGAKAVFTDGLLEYRLPVAARATLRPVA